MTFLKVSNLEKRFEKKEVLKDLDLFIEETEVFSLLGPNASGKTTLLKVISNIYRPTSGKIEVVGAEVQMNPNSVRERVGFVGHETYLYPELTARENLKFYTMAYGVRNQEEKIKEKLKLVGMYPRMNDTVKEFSRGMKQRVSIARALIHEPKLLLLDEPFTGLDFEARKVFVNIIEDFTDESGPVLMSSHDPEIAWRVSQRVGILEKGRIKYILSTQKNEYSNLEDAINSIKWKVQS
ncbi:hypothetical protein AKJ40_02195 [candidate division MSBL1 archaeon SCGC-AAA259M10]|uniref:ABC transporter domain-containing protein n=1 Tax=candidate division MSBL1 archaeon SCGC-AAA259M10 TaxID=1698270 RepID=A0A133V0H0_9EURY|nr:hypothetical protein AKJ40_02195 [candidate division MSBL1 archaeon SCGC-AAA259M10]